MATTTFGEFVPCMMHAVADLSTGMFHGRTDGWDVRRVHVRHVQFWHVHFRHMHVRHMRSVMMRRRRRRRHDGFVTGFVFFVVAFLFLLPVEKSITMKEKIKGMLHDGVRRSGGIPVEFVRRVVYALSLLPFLCWLRLMSSFRCGGWYKTYHITIWMNSFTYTTCRWACSINSVKRWEKRSWPIPSSMNDRWDSWDYLQLQCITVCGNSEESTTQ